MQTPSLMDTDDWMPAHAAVRTILQLQSFSWEFDQAVTGL
jgi:hypothetical protein